MTSQLTRLGTRPEEGVKAPCVVAAFTNITLSGTQTIDGVAVAVGDRVLVAGQTDAAENGIYVASANAWVRATDWNKANDVVSGQTVVVPNAIYQVSYTGTLVIGSTPVTFTVITGNLFGNTYTSSRTGAVARTLQSKFEDQVSVLDFGATGDGVTDDSVAIQAACDSGAGRIYFPKGIYKASFDLQNNQIMYGDGAKNITVIKPPTGALYCVRIDARTVAKQHCQIRDMQFENLDAVASCIAIQFRGTDVNSINDWHTVANVNIRSFDEGIQVTGRQIWSSYYNVEIQGGTRCFTASCDTSTPAFNQNTFIQCRFTNCTAEGVFITGRNTTIGFYTCDFELCNSADVAGVPAVRMETSEEASFIGCYWEDNGGGVAVDAGDPTNNSIGILFSGSYCYVPKIEQAYFVGSGTLIWVAASVRGGLVTNSTLTPLSGGHTLYVSSGNSGINHTPFTFDSSNFTQGLINIIQDGNGNYAAGLEQASNNCYYLASTQAINLRVANKFVVNPNGTTFTGVTTISNRIPGMELWVWNESGVNTFTIDPALIYRGSGVVGALSAKRYMVGGFPANGKLIEM